jgi:hypothetical protein
MAAQKPHPEQSPNAETGQVYYQARAVSGRLLEIQHACVLNPDPSDNLPPLQRRSRAFYKILGGAKQ